MKVYESKESATSETTIPLTKETRDRLIELKHGHDPYDDVLLRLLDVYNEVEQNTTTGLRLSPAKREVKA